MKILKTDEWEFRGIESKEDTLARGFVFQNRKYGDYVVVKAAKYILKHLGVVLFLTFSAGAPHISLSNGTQPEVVHATPLLGRLPEVDTEEQVEILETLANWEQVR